MASGTISIKNGLVLLWTNPSFSSDFTAKTVSLDLKSYDAILVEMSTVFGDATTTRIIRKSVTEMIHDLATSTTNLAFLYRSATPTDTGVQFSGCSMRVQGQSSAQDRNQYLKPRYIYGVRFH